MGVSFLSETGGDLTLEDVKKATQALWQRGVTTYLPTLTTNSHEELLNIFLKLADFKNDKSLLGSIPGFHLEGPYISPEDGYRGAHNLKFIRNPDWNEFMQFYKASGNSILTVTIAPELEGAMEFIKNCTEKGIVVALGHHNANTEIINKAVENGAKICTHLGNGCANLINRHLNPLWPQLSNDKLSISIICDGFHLTPEEIRVFYKVKGSDKTIVTSDVTEYAGMPPGRYKIFDGEEIELTADGELRYPAQKVLYGSASAIDKGVRHIMKVTGCSLADAIKMSSTNPAKLYGLNDRGSIETGKRADLILFELSDSELVIKKTYVNGKLVYDASK
jgi:N-acetylglucosamine-6-phosphate deacetylase